MRLSKLDQFLEKVTYIRGGESLEITFDSNAFTANFFHALSAKMRAWMEEGERKDKERRKKRAKVDEVERGLSGLDEEARFLEAQGAIYAELLSCDKGFVIKGWSATDDNNNPAEPTFENLQKLSPRALLEIFRFLRNYKSPLGQEIVTTSASPTISETTQSGRLPSETTDADLIG